MIDGAKTSHKRADGALVGAVACLILCAAPVIGINLYGGRSIEPPLPLAKPAPVVLGSPVELAGAQLASEGGCLAEAIYYEARGEAVPGQMAVAEVVLRRTHDKNYAKTVCGVVHEGIREGQLGCQFSYNCDGSLKHAKEGEAWEQVRLLAEKIMAGAVPLGDTTQHAIAYHAAYVSPPWKDKMQKTVQIGSHIFYKFLPRSQVVQAGVTPISTAPVPSQEIQPKVKSLRAVGEGA